MKIANEKTREMVMSQVKKSIQIKQYPDLRRGLQRILVVSRVIKITIGVPAFTIPRVINLRARLTRSKIMTGTENSSVRNLRERKTIGLKNTGFRPPCDDDSDDGSSRMEYNSDTTEEFNYFKVSKDTGNESQPRSAEILLVIPDGVGSKSYMIIVCLADTGISTSLGNSKIFGPRSNKKKKVEAVYQTQVGTFETSLEAQIYGVRFP